MPTERATSVTSYRAVFRGALLALVVMSFVVNVLSLTGSFYMLQVYDRVLTSHSQSTLVALSILAVLLLAFQMLIEVIRARVMRRAGDRLERRLMPVAHATTSRLALGGAGGAEAMQPIRDVETIRGYLVSPAPVVAFDLPWLPVYLLFALALHPVFALMTIGGAAILLGLAWTSERMLHDRNASLTKLATRRLAIAEENARNSEAAAAMGFEARLRDRFLRQGETLLNASATTTDMASALTSLSRVFRVMLQSAILGVGAWLTVKGQVTGGAMIAASIVTARALAPIELALASWRPWAQAREARARLAGVLSEATRESTAPTELPAPKDALKLEGVTVVAPGGARVVDGVSFELRAGQGLGIIGASAAGKSSLARAIIGSWPVAAGAVRIDGATLRQWAGSGLGRHVGYMPQDVQLLDGTIAENIARFETVPDSEAVIEAARAANVHAMILRLPKGYDTPIGTGGSHLSAGQRQRIALARALYRDPFLVVLDEPNSNLDGDGEAALTDAVRGVRQRGGIVIMIAHRPSSLQALDMVAVMTGGRLTAFGPRDEVMRGVMNANRPRPAVAGTPEPAVRSAGGGGGFTILTRGPDGGTA